MNFHHGGVVAPGISIIERWHLVNKNTEPIPNCVMAVKRKKEKKKKTNSQVETGEMRAMKERRCKKYF